MLRRVTSAQVGSGGEFYDIPYGRSLERYEGTVSVDTRTFEQHADALTRVVLEFDDDAAGSAVAVEVSSRLRMTATPTDWVVHIDLEAKEGDRVVATREWDRTYPRDRA